MKSYGLIAVSVLFVLLSIAAAGCSEKLTPEQVDELKQKLIEANSNINTYHADVAFDMDMNLTGANLDVLGKQENQELSMDFELTGQGDVDVANRAMSFEGTMILNMFGIKSEVDLEIYLVDGYQYTKTLGFWVKEKVDDEAWLRQHHIGELVALVEKGTIKWLRDENVGGKSFHVVRVTPNLKELFEYVMKQQGSSSGVGDFDALLNEKTGNGAADFFARIFKEFNMDYWVNKETFIIEKSEGYFRIAFSPEDLGIDDGTEGRLEAEVRITATISDINKPVDAIVLPEGAEDAEDLSRFSDFLPDRT